MTALAREALPADTQVQKPGRPAPCVWRKKMAKTNIVLGSGIELTGAPYVWLQVNDAEPFKLPVETSRAIAGLHMTCAAEAEDDAAVFKFLELEFGGRYRPEERIQVIEKLREFRQARRKEAAAPAPPAPDAAPTAEQINAAAEVLKKAGLLVEVEPTANVPESA
jgi:hypothetical protein